MKNIIILFFLIFSVSSFSQEPGSIKGKLIDKENYNQPLAFANVYNNVNEQMVYSDTDGLYTFEDLTPGEYKLTYSFVGYQSVSKTVMVKSGKTTEININFEAAKPIFKKVVSVEPEAQDNTTVLLE